MKAIRSATNAAIDKLRKLAKNIAQKLESSFVGPDPLGQDCSQSTHEHAANP